MVSARYTSAFALAITVANTVAALPSSSSSPRSLSYPEGLACPAYSKSANGSALCSSGTVPVTVKSTNVILNIGEPANQTVVTEYIQELTQSDSTIGTTVATGTHVVSGTYNIDVTFCYPVGANATTVQILTHGIGLDKSYWDIAPGNSYVDSAATAGYATLAYNRLGVGASDYPDPIQVVQAAIDVEIQHGLTQLLREGHFASQSFSNIVATGHSYGSIIVLAQNGKYPTDVQAAVLTGFVNQVTFLTQTVLANNPVIAAENDPDKWGSLPNGYLVDASSVSYQLPFYRFPFYSNEIFNLQLKNKQTYSLGQQFTLPTIYGVASSFNGPVDVVVGENDYPFCHGNCNYPSDLASVTQPQLYPAANTTGSESFIIPNTGHCINAHYAAKEAFSQINAFLAKNQL